MSADEPSIHEPGTKKKIPKWVTVKGRKLFTITGDELLGMDLPEVQYAVPGLIPEGVTILASKPKIGKSRLMLNISVAVATGGLALGNIPVEQGDVLYLAFEGSGASIQKLLRTLKAQQQSAPLNRLQLDRNWPQANKGGIEQIEEWLKAHPDARMVVIDTFGRFRAKRTGRRSNLYAEDVADIEPYERLARTHHVAIVLVHHMRKLPAEDWVEEISGSLGLSGTADGLLGLYRKRNQDKAQLKITGRDLDEQERHLVVERMTGVWSLADDDDQVELVEMSEARKELIALLLREDSPLAPAEIAKRLRKTSNAIRVLVFRMTKEGLLISEDGKYRLNVTNS